MLEFDSGCSGELQKQESPTIKYKSSRYKSGLFKPVEWVLDNVCDFRFTAASRDQILVHHIKSFIVELISKGCSDVRQNFSLNITGGRLSAKALQEGASGADV